MKLSVSAVALITIVISSVQVFMFVGGNGNTNVTITGTAIMAKIYEVCKAVADSEAREFKPSGPSEEELLRACLGTVTGDVSGAWFHTALNQIYMQNGFLDRDLMNSTPHHFNNEAFSKGRDIIIQGIAAVKAKVLSDNLQSAREILGQVCHTLQDFYSQSNWVELGNKSPYVKLIRSDLTIKNTADLAAEATLKLLEGVRGAIGDKDYLRLMGIARSTVLTFVTDTSGNMVENILKFKSIAYNVIDSKIGTQDEPSEYILVPFNDPEFGPLIRTTDPDVMKSEISNIKVNEGGDLPDMCLSAVQLALTGASSSSHIYVFTDGPPKDIGLEKTIINLIRSTKSTVSFFMIPSGGRKRVLTTQPYSDFQVYYDVALASGGQAIEVSKSSLSQVTDIIVDTSTSALVTILQRSRNPGRVESFPFLLDESVSNATIYISGSGIVFTLHSPSGLSQSNTVLNGVLGTIHKVGNLQRIQLKGTETGLWHIDMKSTQSYTIKVFSQSVITFIYDFVEELKGPHPGFAVIDGRPPTGVPVKLLLTLTGKINPEDLEVQEVSLMEVSGLAVSNGTIVKMSDGNVLVTVTEVPEGGFVVLLKGKDMTSHNLFQRQSTTQMSQSKLSIKLMSEDSMQPGEEFQLNYTLTTNRTGGVYTIRANNDKDFKMTHTSKLTLVSGGSAVGKVSISPPADTMSGTKVILTLEAEGPGGNDTNFAMLRLFVVHKTDLEPPQCKVFGVQGRCSSSSCSSSNWELSINITDGKDGTGIESITIQQVNGDFTLKQVENDGATMVMGHYKASCCSPSVTLTAVDKVGNVGTCSYTIETSAGSALVNMTLPLWACLLASALNLLRDTFSL